MSWGSYWGGIYSALLNANATAIVGSIPASSIRLEYQPTGLHATEASFRIRYTPPGSSTTYFYLFWSEGQANGYDTNPPAAGAEYRIRVCRAASPAVSGIYGDDSAPTKSCLNTGAGKVVLASHDLVYGPGAQGLIDDPGGLIIYYRCES